jgi:hypothetical protein
VNQKAVQDAQAVSVKNPPLGGFFGFGGVGLDKSRCSTNVTKGSFGPPQQSGGARRVQLLAAMAIEDNLAGPSKHERARFKRAFLCLKGYHTLELAKPVEKRDLRSI